MDGETADDGLRVLYQAICLQNTPPITSEEQAKCMQPRRVCWRVEDEVASREKVRARG